MGTTGPFSSLDPFFFPFFVPSFEKESKKEQKKGAKRATVNNPNVFFQVDCFFFLPLCTFIKPLS
jgi:hypothetical protein